MRWKLESKTQCCEGGGGEVGGIERRGEQSEKKVGGSPL